MAKKRACGGMTKQDKQNCKRPPVPRTPSAYKPLVRTRKPYGWMAVGRIKGGD